MFSRTFFYALVAINIVLAALLVLPWFGVIPAWTSSAEPERIAKQLSPDLIRVLPDAASQSAPVNSALAIVTEGSIATPTSGQSDSAVASTPTEVTVEVDESRCIAFKGLSDEVAERVQSVANKHATVLKTRSSTTTTSSFWVHIPPDGGREAAEKRAEVLQRNGISDFFVVREAGGSQYAVSLGLYRAENLAKRRLESLQKLGIKTATIAARENVFQRVEVRGASSALDRFVLELGRKTDKPIPQNSCDG